MSGWHLLFWLSDLNINGVGEIVNLDEVGDREFGGFGECRDATDFLKIFFEERSEWSAFESGVEGLGSGEKIID